MRSENDSVCMSHAVFAAQSVRRGDGSFVDFAVESMAEQYDLHDRDSPIKVYKENMPLYTFR